MLPELRSGSGGGEVVGRELGLLREAELSLYRSGSAPPTFEGSLSAVGGLFGGVGEPKAGVEEELRSDPSYLSYYYSHGNLNPRLPPRFSPRRTGGRRSGCRPGGARRGFVGLAIGGRRPRPMVGAGRRMGGAGPCSRCGRVLMLVRRRAMVNGWRRVVMG